MEKETYRIIFYYDSRYNTDRYIITPGTYIDAIKMQNYIQKQGFASNVSRYFVINAQYVSKDHNGTLHLKPSYKDLGHRAHWENQSKYLNLGS